MEWSRGPDGASGVTASDTGEPPSAGLAPEREQGPMTVRAARPSDVPRLAEMYRAEAEQHATLVGGFQLVPGFDWPACVAGLIVDPRRLVLVAEADLRVIGFLHGRLAARLAPGPRGGMFRRMLFFARNRRRRPVPSLADALRRATFGIIEDCWVEPDGRSRGAGGHLVGAALEWFCRHGAASVELPGSRQQSGGSALLAGARFRGSQPDDESPGRSTLIPSPCVVPGDAAVPTGAHRP